MKKFKFIAMALVAISMFSCSKESMTNESDGTQLKGEEAVVTLNLEGTEQQKAGSKAQTDGTGTEGNISDLVIFFFAGNEGTSKLVGSPKFVKPADADGLTNIKLKTTTDATSAYIVANTGVTAANLTTSVFKDVTTLAGLKAAKGDLFKSPTDGTTNVEASTQVKNKLWMVGENGKIDYIDAKSTFKVTLRFVASKIVVKITDNRTNKNLSWDGPNASKTKYTIVDNDIAILFSGAEAGFFTDLSASNTKFYSGLASLSTSNVTLKNTLKTPLNVGATLVDNSFKIAADTPYHFYVFSQTALKSITATIASDKFTSKTAQTPIYYSAIFNASDLLKGKTFESGKLYTLTMILNGDVNTGGGGGTTDPETPVVNADITLTVTAATWGTSIDVSKEFN